MASKNNSGLSAMREYFNEHHTRSFDFRKQQLLCLKKALGSHECEILDALFKDLRKSPEEAYISEFGLVLAEIELQLNNLKKWMRPKRVQTGLIHFPSNSKLYHDPLGVVLIIAPWNYPFLLPLLPAIGAIAAGNCVVIKPSELAPATSAVLTKLINQSFDRAYLQCIEGDGQTVINAMMDEFRFDHIFYTGSPSVGKLIYQKAAEKLIPVTLELGGKSPCIVEKDANLETAAKRIVFGKFLNLGQTCIAPDYLLVHRSVKTQLIDLLKQTIEKYYGETPDKSYDYGRIINRHRFMVLSGYLQGAKILYGGKVDARDLFIGPTLMEGVWETPVMREEIFGPILPVFDFNDTKEAMELVAKNPNPLAFYLFSNNKFIQQQWVAKTAFGGGCINNTVIHFSNPELPFGGVGNSGIGKYHGRFSFDTFSRIKPMMKTATWFDPNLKYPPYRGRLKWFKKILG